MTIRQLQYFCDAAQTENFAMVAEKYTVPPSTVSVAIKHLEEEMGVHLFDRSANRISLNAKGKLLATELKVAPEMACEICMRGHAKSMGLYPM